MYWEWQDNSHIIYKIRSTSLYDNLLILNKNQILLGMKEARVTHIYIYITYLIWKIEVYWEWLWQESLILFNNLKQLQHNDRNKQVLGMEVARITSLFCFK